MKSETASKVRSKASPPAPPKGVENKVTVNYRQWDVNWNVNGDFRYTEQLYEHYTEKTRSSVNDRQ